MADFDFPFDSFLDRDELLLAGDGFFPFDAPPLSLSSNVAPPPQPRLAALEIARSKMEASIAEVAIGEQIIAAPSSAERKRRAEAMSKYPTAATSSSGAESKHMLVMLDAQKGAQDYYYSREQTYNSNGDGSSASSSSTIAALSYDVSPREDAPPPQTRTSGRSSGRASAAVDSSEKTLNGEGMRPPVYGTPLKRTDSLNSVDSSDKKQRKKRCCKICGLPGHDIRTCRKDVDEIEATTGPSTVPESPKRCCRQQGRSPSTSTDQSAIYSFDPSEYSYEDFSHSSSVSYKPQFSPHRDYHPTREGSRATHHNYPAFDSNGSSNDTSYRIKGSGHHSSGRRGGGDSSNYTIAPLDLDDGKLGPAVTTPSHQIASMSLSTPTEARHHLGHHQKSLQHSFKTNMNSIDSTLFQQSGYGQREIPIDSSYHHPAQNGSRSRHHEDTTDLGNSDPSIFLKADPHF